MKTAILLSLALALPMFTSCAQETDAAGNATKSMSDAAGAMGHKAGEMGDKMAEGMKNLDLSNMSMDAIKEKAGSMVKTVSEQLSSVKDMASAEKFKTMAGPMIDNLSKMKDKLGTKLPNMDSLKEAVANFKPDGKVMEMLQPMIDKIKALMA